MLNNPNSMLEMLETELKAISEKTQPVQKDQNSLMQLSQQDGEWNKSLLLITKRMVGAGKTDEEIHAITDDLTQEGFTVSQTRRQVQKMIQGARAKYGLDFTALAEERIEELSKLSPLEYETNRNEAAKELNLRVKVLDKQVTDRRIVETETNDIVEPVSPWPDPVNAIKMADYIELTIQKHIALRHPEYATAITLWSLSTWLVDAWKIMPHLFFRSLTKGSGKTTALHLVEALAARSYVAANITPAALFRVIEQHSPTLLLDEVDRYLAQDEVLNGIMNAGHTRRTATVTRLEEVDGDYVPRKFKVFGGKCMAGIGKQLDTMMDRSIIVKMEKRLSNERVIKLPLTFFENHLEARRKIARFAEDNRFRATELAPNIPNLGNDRAQDNWLPLFIVSELIGGDWPKKCLAAYTKIEALSAEDAKDQETVVVRILRELAPHLENRVGHWVPSDELRSLLISDPDSEFCEWHIGNPISAKSIKKHLRDAGVEHRRDKQGSHYNLGDLSELIKRYVHQCP